MQNSLQIFNYNNSEVRMIMVEGEPWWIGKDVCEILEFINSSETLKRLDEDEVSSTEVTDNLGRKQITSIVNEAGLFNLILGSRKPEAKVFKRWVTHELLPQIRKTGSYLTPNVKQDKKEKDYEFRMKRELRLSQQLNVTKARVLQDTAKIFAEVLSDVSLQGIASEVTRLLTGKEIIPQPALECKYWSATDIVNEFLEKTGIKFTVQKLGRIANEQGLKTDDYGKYFLSKSQHSEKQVSTWMYNLEGKNKAFELLQNLN